MEVKHEFTPHTQKRGGVFISDVHHMPLIVTHAVENRILLFPTKNLFVRQRLGLRDMKKCHYNLIYTEPCSIWDDDAYKGWQVHVAP